MDNILEEWTEDITGVNEKVSLEEIAHEEPCRICKVRMPDKDIFWPYCSENCRDIAHI